MLRTIVPGLMVTMVGSAMAQEEGPMVGARICQWYHGHAAAVSMRFDDAHPTHLSKAAPMLSEYGLVGTFLVNTDKTRFQESRDEWAAAVEQGHELGNHTANHHGAKTDAEAEYEIAECSRVIHGLQPRYSPLLAFQRGGATKWLQRKPMSYFVQRYDLFDPPGSSYSCSEAYSWFSVEAVAERMKWIVPGGHWLQTHYHGVDEGHLVISSEALRGLCELFSEADMWSAGMSSIYRYQEEREASDLSVAADGDDALNLSLVCGTDQRLYDHPLTVEVVLADGVSADDATVAKADGEAVTAWAAGEGVQFDVAPEDGVYVVTAEGIGAAYAAAHGGYEAPGRHPYVYFGAAGVEALREKRAAPVAAELWEHVKGAADRIMEQDPPPADTDADAEKARRHARDAATLAFVHALTGEAGYAERAVPEVEAVLAASAWVHAQHPGEADLVSAEVTCGLALTYDWAHDALPEELRVAMVEAMVARGLEPTFADAERRVWWSVWPKGNWGAVIFGQAGVAAIALLDEEPRAQEWVRTCRQRIWLYTKAIGEDGGWGESVSYSIYCWRNATMFMDALARLTGGSEDLFGAPGPEALPAYYANLMLPNESDFVPFSNYGHGVSPNGFLLRLAREYDDGHARRMGAWKRTWDPVSNALGFVWCDPELAQSPASELPLTKHFRTVDWAVMRSAWDDPDATLLAFKGGDNEWDHYHHDYNSFALWSRGIPLLIELGYPHELWGVKTEAHNTVMVAGEEQLGDARIAGRRGDPRQFGKIGHVADAGWYAHLTGDASAVYDPATVSSFVREIMYLRSEEGSPEYFIMFDDVVATQPVRMDWIAHTYGELQVDGSTVTVTQDNAAADIMVVEPEGLVQEVLEKSFEEAGVSRPFEAAKADTFVKVRPSGPVERGQFLTVIAPRGAEEQTGLSITPVRSENVVGVKVAHGETEDVALFAIEEPLAAAEGIRLTGRSCFVRRVGGVVTRVAIEQAQELEIDGDVWVGGSGAGQMTAAYEETAVAMTLGLYDANETVLRVPKEPVKCVAGGKERELEYDEAESAVTLRLRGAREARVVWE